MPANTPAGLSEPSRVSTPAGLSEQSRTTCAPLTREDVRDELKHFLWESFAHEIKDLGKRVQQDVQKEFRHFLEEFGAKERHQLHRYLENGLVNPQPLSPKDLIDLPGRCSVLSIATKVEREQADLTDITARAGRLSDRYEARITKYTRTSARKTMKDSTNSIGGEISLGRNNLVQLPALNNPGGKASKYTASSKVYSLDKVNQASQVATLQDMTPKALRRSDSSSSEISSVAQAWGEDLEGIPKRPSRHSESSDSLPNSVQPSAYSMLSAATGKGSDGEGSKIGDWKPTESNGPRKSDAGRSEISVGKTMTSKSSVKQFSAAHVDGESDYMMNSKSARLNPVRKVVGNIVRSENFDYFMGFFLVMNAVTLGIQVDVMASRVKNNSEVPFHFRVLDWVYFGLFSAELLARLFVHGGRMYRMKGAGWMVFDTVIVVFQLLEELTVLFLSGTGVQKMIDNLGILNMLRLGRIVRLLRMVRLIPELKSMVYLISASMNAFFWTVVLLFIMMYIVAVYYTQLAANLARDNPDLASGIASLWGSVMQSVLSLYQAITGGDDWCNFIEVFRGSSSGMFIQVTLVFTIYIAFATLVMLNLVTGVFVEGAQRIIKEDKDTELIRHVCRLFVIADQDQSQEISWTEFEEHLEDKGMNEYFKAVDLSRREAKDLFKLLDVDGSGSISVEEFVRGCIRLRGPARSVDLAALVYDFKLKTRRSEDHMLQIEESMARLGKTLSLIYRSVADIQPVESWSEDVEGILV